MPLKVKTQKKYMICTSCGKNKDKQNEYSNHPLCTRCYKKKIELTELNHWIDCMNKKYDTNVNQLHK
jgi:NMD protein affecting ribosome stability and mRNA decay